MEFTFLTKEQVIGDEQLEILKIYGNKCEATDFAILLGLEVSSDEYTCEDSLFEHRSSIWALKSSMESAYLVDYIDANGKPIKHFALRRFFGGRPVLSFTSIKSLNKIINEYDILEIEYGEYPQTVESEEFGQLLEKTYINKKINETGKNYITDSNTILNYNLPFSPRIHIEYEYNGEKYIRFIGDKNCDGKQLSDGRIIKKGDVYWVKVESIKWMIEENIALSKKILFSGVQYTNEEYYTGHFEETNIYKFMNKYLVKDIIPSIINKKHNNFNLNFDEVSEEDIIKGMVESDIPVFLHGRSSEGKSARVKQIDPDCVIIYLRNATLESLNGKSVYNSETGEMIDVKPTWLKKLEENCEKEPDKYHIVFLDEITNALPSIQGMAFNIVLDREVNGIWQLPKNARIIAAGNDMKDSLAVNELAEPLFNRFAHVYIQTTVGNWLKWASKNNIHPAIYAYITYKKENALRGEFDGIKPNADPRKWEMASKVLYKTGKPEMLRALVGEDITKEFINFCTQPLGMLTDILNDNYKKEDIDKLSISEKYSLAFLLSQVDEVNFEKVRMFVTLLGKEPYALFKKLCIWNKNAEKKLIKKMK